MAPLGLSARIYTNRRAPTFRRVILFRGSRELTSQRRREYQNGAPGMTDRSTALGLSNAEVRHAMAHDRWAIAYEYEARLLNAALGPLVLDIQHVGSTAVPGLLAKPILDIIIAVSDLNYVPAIEPALLNVGWIRRPTGDTVDRRYFVKGVPEWRTGHLSVVA